MASYRFCRSDDVGLLVDAYNACYRPVTGFTPIDVDQFKRWIRTLELWTSSCMVASEGEKLLGVLLAAKREEENCVLAIGIDEPVRHQDHGRHLMTSLSQKLAILGPHRMICEVPSNQERIIRFLEHCDYSAEAELHDYLLEQPTAAPAPAAMIAEVSLDDIDSAEFSDVTNQICWGRAPRAIARREEYFKSLRCVALVGVERLEAALIFEENELLAIRHHADEKSDSLVGALIAATAQGPIHWKRVHVEECDPERAERWGFRRVGSHLRMSCLAEPA